MKQKYISCILALMMLLVMPSCIDEQPAIPEPYDIDTEEEAETPDAGDNFYGYINKDYLEKGQIPYGRNSFGTMDKIEDEMEIAVSVIIEVCKESEQQDGSREQMISDLYKQYLDTDAREKKGADSVLKTKEMIEDCKTIDELTDVMGKLYNEYNIRTMFTFNAYPDTYDTSKYSLYLCNMNTLGNMKENFTKTENGSESLGDLARDTLVALNVDREQAKSRATNVVKMVDDIMRSAMDSDLTQNMAAIYHPYTTQSFSELFSNINTKKLMDSYGFESDEIIVMDVEQSKKINEYMTNDNIQVLKDYLLTCMMFAYGKVMPPSISEQITAFSTNGAKKEDLAKEFVSTVLGEEVGYLYGEQICTEKVMDQAEKMLDDIKTSCRTLINDCSRLSDDSKKKFTKKLDNMIFLVGYNKNSKSPYKITSAKNGGDLIGNYISIMKTQVKESKKKLSTKVDRNEWGMNPITVNAQYDPSLNTVTIPAAMLSPASFSPSDGEYKNLGKLGHTIAHEMNHAFDSNGFCYDENGCYNDKWISEQDTRAYNEVMVKAEEYYSNYKILDIYNINGKMTLAENLADIGGFQCVISVTKDKSKLKKIFEGYAEQWASLEMTVNAIDRIYSDIHSPAEARVNAVVSSCDSFYEVYDVDQSQKMYIDKENRIKVW